MTKFQTCVQILVASSKMEEETKSKKESAIPRAGIEPATFRLYVSITAERHIQLDHRGLTCDLSVVFWQYNPKCVDLDTFYLFHLQSEYSLKRLSQSIYINQTISGAP